MPIIVKKNEKRKNIYRIHEKNIGLKHKYSILFMIIAAVVLLFLAVFVIVYVFSISNYSSDRGTAIVVSLLAAMILYLPVVYQWYVNNKFPYCMISYDTRYKWFKVYNNNKYYYIRPTEITYVYARNFFVTFGDGDPFGRIIFYTKHNENGVIKEHKIKAYCMTPLVVKREVEENIHQKLLDDLEKEIKKHKGKKPSQSRIIENNDKDKTKNNSVKPKIELEKKEAEYWKDLGKDLNGIN